MAADDVKPTNVQALVLLEHASFPEDGPVELYDGKWVIKAIKQGSSFYNIRVEKA